MQHATRNTQHATRNTQGAAWRVAFAGFVAFLLVVIVGAYLRLIPTEIAAIPFYDTLGHFGLLGVAAWLGHRAAGRRGVRVGRFQVPLVPLIVFAVAAIEEAGQGFSAARTADLADLAADGAGIVFFVWLDGKIAASRWRGHG